MEQDPESDNSFQSHNSSISQASQSDENNDLIINPETNEIEKSEEIEDDPDYVPVTYNKHINRKEERIICVELKNNNKVYIAYDDSWTVKQVFKL